MRNTTGSLGRHGGSIICFWVNARRVVLVRNKAPWLSCRGVLLAKPLIFDGSMIRQVQKKCKFLFCLVRGDEERV